MKFTAVIPTRNREVLVGRAIASVLAQSMSDLELIVVDDGSTDGTAQAVAAIDDPRVRLLRTESAQGPSGARNLGMRAANGEYLAFLDSDDEWHREKLQQNLEFIRGISNDAWFAFNQVVVHAPRGNRVLPSKGPRSHERLLDYLLVSRGFIQTSAVFGPRNHLAKTGFNESLRNLEDWSFYAALAERGAVHFQSAALTTHYAEPRADRLSRRLTPTEAEQWLQMHKEAMTQEAETAYRLLRLAPSLKAHGHAVAARRMALASYCRLLGQGHSPPYRPLASLLLRP